VSRKQINDLWEAVHPIPDLLCHWRTNAESQLLRYLNEYNARWPSPDLRVIYQQALDGAFE
jgi:hypothetical protein